jgi:hypothetical protein
MAYIPWYDRLKPATLGERFGLNEISTARNTLSPTNSHTAGLSDMFPGTFTSYQDALAGGFQGTMEEWLQQQSIPQIDRPLAGGGRVSMKPGGLVEPGVTHYGDPAVKKLKNPPDPKKPWRYLRTGNQRKVGGAKRITQYFATEQEALAAQVEARKIKYEAATKVPKSDFNKIKQRIIKGETLEQIAETYKSTIKPIEKLLYDNNTNYTKLTPNVSYLEDADSLKYIKENYGKLKGETLGKALYPDLPASTQQARVRRLVTKLLAQKEIKYTPAALIEEVREEQGFNPEKSTKKVQTERVAAKKKFSVPVFETAMQGSKASQLSHMGDLYNEIVRFETLGYSPQRINQEVLKNVDPYLKTLVEKRATLLKNKPPGYEAKVNEINIKGEAVARSTKGYKSFEVIEPSGKSYILGKDYAKSIDPLGHFEGKTIQEIAPEKISRRSKILEQMIPDPGERKLFIKNAKAVQKSQAKVSKAKIDKIAKDLTNLGFDTSPKVAKEIFSSLDKKLSNIKTGVEERIEILKKIQGTNAAKNSKYLEALSKIPGKPGQAAKAIILGTASALTIATLANASTGDQTMPLFNKQFEYKPGGDAFKKLLTETQEQAGNLAAVAAAGAITAKNPTEVSKLVKKPMRFGWRAFERGLMPFFSALHYAIEGKWPDPTKTEELLLASFWNKLMKKYKWGHKSTDPLRRKLLNFLKRGMIPSSAMPLVSKIAGWGMIPAELYQGHKALTNISEKEKKIAEIALKKGYDVNKVINMYRYAHNKFGFNREWFYKPLYRDLALSQKLLEGKTKPEFAELWLKNKWKDDPEYEEIKKIFDNEYIAKHDENKKRGELRRAKHYINEKSKYYVPFPTSKQIKNYKLGQSIGFSGEEDVLKDSVIGKVRKTSLTELEQKDIQKRKEALPTMISITEQAYKRSKQEGITYEDALKKIKQELADKETPLDIPGIEFKDKDDLATGGIASLLK